jgi:hypothetical protein
MKTPFKMGNVLNTLTCSLADTDTDHKLVILSSFLFLLLSFHCEELAFALFSSSVKAAYLHL